MIHSACPYCGAPMVCLFCRCVIVWLDRTYVDRETSESCPRAPGRVPKEDRRCSTTTHTPVHEAFVA